MSARGRFVVAVGAGVVALLAAIVVAPTIGTSDATLSRAFAGISPDYEILFRFRLPRVLLAALTGAALALAGVLFQALLRDALATPFTLGVQSGAALGAVVAICMGWGALEGVPAVWLAAFTGALATIATVVSVASEGRRMSSFTLLLTGVTINAMATAAILFLHSSAGFQQSFAIVRWLMGGIGQPRYLTLALVATAVGGCFVWAMAASRTLNLLAAGEEWAATRGASLGQLKLMTYLAGSLLTASVTALTGPIGFIGLLVPHALRLALGPDHRALIPAAFLAGGTFLVVCDTVARTALSPAEIPVGVITALLGGPSFIWLLKAKRGSLWV